MVQRFAEIGGLAVLVGLLIVVGAIALSVETGRLVRRAWRRRAVARELARPDLSVAPSTLTVSDRRPPAVVRPEVPALRAGEPRDPTAAKVLAFRLALARKGYYVDELQIRKRIN
jgi:hypothetical protein